MTTRTADTIHVEKLIRQQEETIRQAVSRWMELYSQLVELRQQAQDNRPAMRALLAAQGAAAVAKVEEILLRSHESTGG